MKKFAIAALIATALAVFSYLDGPVVAQTTAPQPTVTATTLAGSSGQLIINANPTRRSIRICNTGATNPIWIWPGISTTLVSDYVLAPVASNVITCYTPPTNPIGNAGSAYYAIANGNGAGTVSVEEWN